MFDAVIRHVASMGRRSGSGLSRNNRSIQKCIVQNSKFHVPRLQNENVEHYHGIRTMVMITQTKGKLDSNDDVMKELPNQINQKLQQQPHDQLPPSQQPPTNEELSVFVTDACYQRIHYLVSQKKKNAENNAEECDNYYLRVFVDAGGCSGFTYQFELDTDKHLNPTEDVVFTESSSSSTAATSTDKAASARVVIDRGSLSLLAGSKIDYVQEMIKSTFEVRDNPQSESACGCGSSFAIKNFTSNPAID